MTQNFSKHWITLKDPTYVYKSQHRIYQENNTEKSTAIEHYGNKLITRLDCSKTRSDLECSSQAFIKRERCKNVWFCPCFLELTITQKNCRPGEVWLLCSFYHEPLRTWIKTIVNKFAISNHTALISGVHALISYLKLICEYELYSLPNKKVSGAKDHGKHYIKVRPARSAIFCVIVYWRYR